MSLATIEADIRNGVENGINWIRTVAEEHLPKLAAEAQRIQASPIVQVLESAVLTPAEEAMIAKLIGELVALRGGSQGPVAASEAPVQAETPAEAPQEPSAVAEPAPQPA